MGSISAFGTGCAALILALASSAPAQASEATLDLTVNGLRNAKGSVLICVTGNPKAFPDCSKDANSRKLKIAAGQAGHVSISGLAPGTYAVAIIHDENNNNKMDVFVMPKEGFGFSRNPRIMFGPPKYAEAAIALAAGENRQMIKLNYYL
ncbi:MAG: DUF2141 domain-containing protein [Sphingomonadales bacterium]|nr:DUF2141 domain-containing protein [Sphingomonadales bacterium]